MFYYYLSELGGDPNLTEIKFGRLLRGVGDRYVFGCIFFANFGTFFLYTNPTPLPPPGRRGKGGVGDRYVLDAFFFANFGTFFLYT